MKIAFVTCNRLLNGTETDKDVAEILENKGIHVSFEVWNNENVIWSEFDGVIIRTCWDYHLYPEDFVCWLNKIESDKVNVWNSIDLIKWNMDKIYLKDLSFGGVSIPPTVWVSDENEIPLREVIERTG